MKSPACFYQIKVQGELDRKWSDWFDGFEMHYPCCGQTVLSGQVKDQGELHGLLSKLRDLGLPLLSVSRIDEDNLKLSMRKYSSEKDYWEFRAFLRDTLLLNELRLFNWHVARLDYWRWHVHLNVHETDQLNDQIYYWETSKGQLAAVLNSEGPGQVYLQVHQNFKTAALCAEMLRAAEENFAIERDGRQVVRVWADPNDSQVVQLLQAGDYHPGKWTETIWRRDLLEPLPDVQVPDGYSVRALEGGAELPARSWASWRGFHPDDPDEAYEGWEWYCNVQRCPLYRRGLDIVAIAPGGEIASFCTVWYDDATRTAMLEPVATVPEHLRRGLARAVIIEGMRRVQAMGAVRIFVGGYEDAPNQLYRSTFSEQFDQLQQWEKNW